MTVSAKSKVGNSLGKLKPVTPRNRPKASLEMALLGLIAESGEASGYELLRVFRISMAHYWHAHQAQIYSTLEKLRAAGLISSREVVQRGRPNKWLFSITANGRDQLREWLRSPYEGLKLKHAPLLRCRFLSQLTPSDAIEVLTEERKAAEHELDRYRSLEREFFSKKPVPAGLMFPYFTLRRGILFYEETIRWCEWACEEIRESAAASATRLGTRRSDRRNRARVAAN